MKEREREGCLCERESERDFIGSEREKSRLGLIEKGGGRVAWEKEAWRRGI